MSENQNEKVNNQNELNFSDETLNSEEQINFNQKIEELEKERNLWKDKFLRKAAEFENYKKRLENDQINLINYANESLIKKFLPIVDDFERSLKHLNDSKDFNLIKTGIELIYNKLIKTLEEQGVSQIHSIGKPFDINQHEAIMQKDDPNVPPHTVLEELEKGYLLKDKVIRFAKVVVSSDN